jgi:RNA polymerase subunit RPABC4/transcription elongation factor Spt4
MSDPARKEYAAPWLIPLAERKRRNADLPRPDMSPLSEAEKQQLRARLNDRGPGPVNLTPREYDAWMDMTVIRSPEDIAALAARVNADTPGEYGGGILHAILWATGQFQEGPITGRIPEGPLPTVSEMAAEEQAAVRVLRWQQECARPRDYVSGVEACLLWLRGAGHERPW